MVLKPLSIDISLAQNYLLKDEHCLLADYLKNVFKLERDKSGAPISYELSVEVVTMLQNILTQINKEELNNNKNLLRELFKSLRIYVINPDVQNYIVNDCDLLSGVKTCFSFSAKMEHDIIRIILQFLINLIVSNQSAAVVVHQYFLEKLTAFLKEKVQVYETSALLYNISLYHDLILDFDTYRCVLELCNTEDIEFIYFLLEKFITYEDFWNHYENFELHERTVILGTIRQKQINGELLILPEIGIKRLSNHFINSGSIIFQMKSNSKATLEAYEVSHLLQIISSLCGVEQYLQILQKNKDLLINSGVFLINLHNLGKETQNCFTPIQNLSEIREPSKNINEHPAFGFKADLIRIVGNLCWKNKTMQDLTREAELIPVILDCSNIDARNPFIMQWVILAVRNLCEKNFENQKIIAEMHQEGTVSTSVLEEMGLTLHSEGENSIKIVPMEVLRNKK